MLANIRMVSLEIVNDETIARIFKKSSDATFMRVVNLRLFDETVIAREVAWYDLSTAPKLLEWDKHGSIHRYLEQVCQIKLIQPEKSIEARLSINPESKIFGFKGHLPCLLMKSRTCNSEGKLIEYVETTFKGDDYKYYVKAEV
jgi:GntR family transcriptional regulator